MIGAKPRAGLHNPHCRCSRIHQCSPNDDLAKMDDVECARGNRAIVGEKIEFLNDWVTKTFSTVRDKKGYRLYALSATFKEPKIRPLSIASLPAQTKSIYAFLLRTVVHRHKWNLPAYREMQPIMFAFPDLPASKIKFQMPSANCRPQEGAHIHSVVAAHPETVDRFERLVGHDTLTLAYHRQFNPFQWNAFEPKDPCAEDLLLLSDPDKKRKQPPLVNVRTSHVAPIHDLHDPARSEKQDSLARWVSYITKALVTEPQLAQAFMPAPSGADRACAGAADSWLMMYPTPRPSNAQTSSPWSNWS